MYSYYRNVGNIWDKAFFRARSLSVIITVGIGNRKCIRKLSNAYNIQMNPFSFSLPIKPKPTLAIVSIFVTIVI